MKIQVVLLAVALIGSVIVHLALGLPLGISLLIFFVGWPLIGTLVTLDDDLRGGWSNPDGTVRPPWLQTPFWGQITAGLAISGIGFAVDVGWRTAAGAKYLLLVTASGFIAASLITRKWWLAAGSAVGAAVLWL